MSARLPQIRACLTAGTVLVLLSGCSGGGRHAARGDVEDDGDAGRLDGGGLLTPDGGGFEREDAEVLPQRTLAIQPDNPTLEVSGSAATLSLTVTLDGRELPAASWSTDNLPLGSIDDKGVFHSAGLVAGQATITARYSGYEASTVIRVVSKLEHVADGVTAEQKTLLEDGTPVEDPALRWLYPYDGTVFPRGLPGPFMQFGGGAADALRVSVKVGDFSYAGYFAASDPAGVSLPSEVWDALTQSADGKDPVEVEVLKLSGTTLTGPTTQKWRVAPGNLKGVIYYNTYKSALTNTGAVMRIRPGSDAEVLIGGCTVCHSVSAQGNVLAAGVEWGSGNPLDSSTFDLRDDGTAPVRYGDAEGRRFAFAGLTPDGSMLVSNGVPASGSPVRGLEGEFPSKLYDSQTGQEVAVPSFTDQVTYAVTPAFSPGGERLAFSWYDMSEGKTLAMMDVNLGMKPPVFGEPKVVASVTDGIVGWPSFFPDGKGIVFQEGERFDTAGYGGTPVYAELRLADTETGTVKALEALNGWLAANDTYLPYGADEESRRDYEPSVLPVPVGGYYWVLFTSRRAYGHTLAPGGTVAGSDNEWGEMVDDNEVPSLRKKLWIAAIDLNYSGKGDPSHPAFYLPGQELNAGNMRAYAALEPCHQEGDSCESGADCCGGFCRRVEVNDEFKDVLYTCVPPPVGCSNIDESCQTDADCCGAEAGDTCINHRCASPNVIIQ